MPLPAEEVLKQLIQAQEDGRKLLRELHEAHKSLRTAWKDQKEQVTNAIVTEVTKQLGELEKSVVADMHTRVNDVIDEIAGDFRVKLGLA